MINIWNNHFYIKESKKQSWKVWNRAGELDIVEKLSKKLWDKYLNGPFSLLCRHFPHWVGEGPSLMWKMAHFTTSVGILGSSMRLTAFSSTPGLYYVTLPTGSVKVPHSSPATVRLGILKIPKESVWWGNVPFPNWVGHSNMNLGKEAIAIWK